MLVDDRQAGAFSQPEARLAELLLERFGPVDGSDPGITPGEAQWLAARWAVELQAAPIRGGSGAA